MQSDKNVENTSEASRVTPAGSTFAKLRFFDNFLQRTSALNFAKKERKKEKSDKRVTSDAISRTRTRARARVRRTYGRTDGRRLHARDFFCHLVKTRVSIPQILRRSVSFRKSVPPIDLHPEPHQAPLCSPTSCLDLEAAILWRRDSPQGNVSGAAEVWSYWRAKRASGTVLRFDRGRSREDTDVRIEREEQCTAGCHY